jgi:hypothetical protein
MTNEDDIFDGRESVLHADMIDCAHCVDGWVESVRRFFPAERCRRCGGTGVSGIVAHGET